MPLVDFAMCIESVVSDLSQIDELDTFRQLRAYVDRDKTENALRYKWNYSDFAPLDLDSHWRSICWDLAKGSPSEFRILFEHTHVLDVYQMYAHVQTELITRLLNTDEKA